MNKNVVAICVSDIRYGKKLFDYLNDKFANICEYMYYDSLSKMNMCNIGVPVVIVLDEPLLQDFILKDVDYNMESLRVVVLTEQKDGATNLLIENTIGMNITFIYRYQSAHNICTEITKF